MQVEPGDLILVQSEGRLYGLARRWPGGPYDHVAVVACDGGRATRDSLVLNEDTSACYAANVAMLSKADLLKLDVAARLELIEELWESIASDEVAASQLPLTETERAMLDDRLQEHREDPESGQSWAEVRAEILKRR